MCGEIRARIETRRDQVCREITDYPTPIPACDVHFNRLLEERRKVFEDLDRLGDLCASCRVRAADVGAIDRLIASSSAIEDKDRAELRDLLLRAGRGA
ncbi:MAG: hypothetical protein OEZ08_02705 [Betaproteobacteria bacterium]|nr:hypothetical protein [Betaproteobacteria bacterium]